jgi:hypothetical protein
MTAKAVSVHIVATNHRSDVVSEKDVQLEKTWSGYEATVTLPWSVKVCYKFHVDERWLALATQEREVDGFGHDNNIYWTPQKTDLDDHCPLVKVPTPDDRSVSALHGTKYYAVVSFLAVVLLGVAAVLGQYMKLGRF